MREGEGGGSEKEKQEQEQRRRSARRRKVGVRRTKVDNDVKNLPSENDGKNYPFAVAFLKSLFCMPFRHTREGITLSIQWMIQFSAGRSVARITSACFLASSLRVAEAGCA